MLHDVIASIMRTHYIDYSLDAVSGNDNIAISRTQDWLQAGESDYEFLRRLMAKAHIYYYFQHTGNGHTVVFANRAAYPKAFGDRPLRYTHTAINELGLQQNDVVFQYSYQQSLSSSGAEWRLCASGRVRRNRTPCRLSRPLLRLCRPIRANCRSISTALISTV